MMVCDACGTSLEARYEPYSTHHTAYCRRPWWQCRWPNSELDPRRWWCGCCLRARHWLDRFGVPDGRRQWRHYGLGHRLSEGETGELEARPGEEPPWRF